MANIEEKNNPPLWLMILGIIIVSAAAYFVMLAPTKPYTQKSMYYLKDAQSQIVNQHTNIDKPLNFVRVERNYLV